MLINPQNEGEDDLKREADIVKLIQPPKLDLITGGKGGGNNWLIKLEPGTIFLAKPVHGNLNLPKFMLLEQEVHTIHGRAVKLLQDLNGESLAWVDSDEYCNIFNCFEILTSEKDD